MNRPGSRTGFSLTLSRLGRAASLVTTIIRFGSSPFWRWLLHLPPPEPTFPVRVRLAIEHLGLTYIKLGQYLAMRFDILPPDVCRELGRLFEGVAPMEFAVVEDVVTTNLEARWTTFSTGSIRRPWPRRRWRKSMKRGPATVATLR